ncbi:MAG: dienelactone hydrolase family protein [Chloroflexi bacterium]|nr:MAG: dienelactone hydrolase family protein [Chloroflexota bacterium]
MLVSADGTRFRGYLARADDGDAGVVINPDVRGLHPFYEELAERFASAGVNAIAFDYFGRSAGTDRRADAFEYMPHVRETRPQTVYADIAATRAHLERQTGARRIFVLGFCFGGRLAFLQSAELSGVAGVIGFYGRLGKRENETWPTPAEEAKRMRAPVLGLFGGDDPSIPPADVAAFDRALSETNVRHHLETYPGAPHSFFDRTFREHQAACEDAWRRALGFIRTGDPSKAA